MMVQWQRGLNELDSTGADQAVEFWSELSDYGLNEHGRKTIKRLLRKFGMERLLEAMRISAEAYLDYDDEGEVTQASVEIAIKKLGGICSVREAEKEKPWLKDVFYIRGILRNRLSYCDLPKAKDYMEIAISWGAEIPELKRIALNATSWTNWQNRLWEYVAELKKEVEAAEEE